MAWNGQCQVISLKYKLFKPRWHGIYEYKLGVHIQNKTLVWIPQGPLIGLPKSKMPPNWQNESQNGQCKAIYLVITTKIKVL
jgi:hypothetical protein